MVLARSLRDLDWFVGRKNVDGGWTRLDWWTRDPIGEGDVDLILNGELLPPRLLLPR